MCDISMCDLSLKQVHCCLDVSQCILFGVSLCVVASTVMLVRGLAKLMVGAETDPDGGNGLPCP